MTATSRTAPAAPRGRDDFGTLLSRRVGLSAALLLGPLLAALAIAALLLQSNRVATAYDKAFVRITNALHEAEFDLMAASRDSVARLDSRLDSLEASYLEMLGVYMALRLADPDGERMLEGEAEGDEELAGLLGEAARARGIDPREGVIELGIAGTEMPEALSRIWEADEDDWAAPSEAVGGAEHGLEISLAHTLLALEAVLSEEGTPLNALAAARRVVIDEMGPANHHALEALDEVVRDRLTLGARLPLYVLGGIALVLLGGMAIVYLRVMRPFAHTLSTMQRALEDAREEARASERAKSEFLASMSHEIRTPMNGVMGMAELMAGTHLDKRQRMFIDIIQSSAGALLGIINDILDFSKIDAGRMEMDPAPFEVRRLASEPVQLVSERAAAKGLDLAVRVDPRSARHAVGDFGRLRQVVTNIVGNAVKFTDCGQVEIDLCAHPEGEGVRLVVEVRDTGIGIPPEKLATIFDRFTQIDQSASRAHDGTGLGLAISKGLVEEMGGTIEADSAPGQGTRFRIEVPLGAHECSEAERTVPRAVRGSRILAIDDNATNRLIVEELLASWGFEAALAASGPEGLERIAAAAAEGRPFDLLLLDHHMPGMDGAEVARRVRAAPESAALPIVLLTSIAEDVGVETCRRLGIASQIVKPVMSSPLLDGITEALQGTGSAAAAPAPAREPGEAAPPEPGARGTVLVVEDNRVNRVLAEQMLKTIGFRCVTAPDGFDGIEKARAVRPDAILMDVSMPGIDGYEATARIRAAEAEAGRPPTPVIGVTAHALPADRDRCLANGMDDYLAKPITLAALDGILSRHAAAPGRGDAAA